MKKQQNFCRRHLAVILFTAALALHLHGWSATFIVTSTADSGPGSLRQAVEDNNWFLGSNNIVIATFGTIDLAGGELLITNNANIIGPGAALLRVDANYSSRVFHIVNATVTISDLTITRGSNSLGGGLLQEFGALNLNRCAVIQNRAVNGGGIAQTDGTMHIADSTISSNSAAGTGLGIYIQGSATSTVRRSTFAANVSLGGVGSGGGITHSGSALILETCTFSANGSTNGNGGGLLNNSGNVAITNCTLVENYSLQGGGIAVMGGTVTVRNTILALNSSIGGGAMAPDCYGSVISGGFNLVGNRTNSTGWGALGDLLGTTAGPINPLLGPLTNNGGYTWTMAPQNDSPATDRGHSSGAALDQRGQQRPFDQPQIPNALGGDGSDIGAFEGNPKLLVVTTVNDFGPGSLRQALLDAAPVDLTQIDFAPDIEGSIIALTNELILNKNLIINGPGAAAMALQPVLPGTRALHVTGGNSTLSGFTIRNCQVTGTVGAFETIGNDAFGGAILNESTLHLTDTIISNNVVKGGQGGSTDDGFAGEGGLGNGGAVANFGLLSLTRCVLANNVATGGDGGQATQGGVAGGGGIGQGGSLFNSGNAYLTNCCVHSSTAVGGNGMGPGVSAGGGIYNFTNSLSLWTCTVASNKAIFGYGGGICDNGSNGVYRSTTIGGNQSSFGGGVFASGADFGNTLIGANTATTGPDVNGTLFSSDYNLIQRTNSAMITGETSHTLRMFPFLGSLQDNGGPTPTMALLPGSPAIDQGKNFGMTTDQRGKRRPFRFGPFPSPPGGDGSDIGAFEVLGALLRIARLGTNAVVSWPTNEPSLKLQSSSFLNPHGPSPWSDVPGTPEVSGKEFTIIEPLAAGKFYRLKGY